MHFEQLVINYLCLYILYMHLSSMFHTLYTTNPRKTFHNSNLHPLCFELLGHAGKSLPVPTLLRILKTSAFILENLWVMTPDIGSSLIPSLKYNYNCYSKGSKMALSKTNS